MSDVDQGIQLRSASSADQAAVVALHVLSRTRAYRPFLAPSALKAFPGEVEAFWSRWFAAPPGSDRLLVIAREANDLVGFGLCEVREDRVMIRALHVHPSHQGRGIGTTLLRRLVDAAAGWGFREPVLHVIAQNNQARRFYEAHDWVDTGHRHRHELGGTDVAVVEYRYTGCGARRRGRPDMNAGPSADIACSAG